MIVIETTYIFECGCATSTPSKIPGTSTMICRNHKCTDLVCKHRPCIECGRTVVLSISSHARLCDDCRAARKVTKKVQQAKNSTRAFHWDNHEYLATLDEVAEELGVTRERARQIEASALRKLADAFVTKHPTLVNIYKKLRRVK